MLRKYEQIVFISLDGKKYSEILGIKLNLILTLKKY